MNAGQLRDLIIKPSLEPLGLYSDAIGQLLLATCAQESHIGDFIAQIHGPALGIFEVEEPTFLDITQNFLKYHPSLEAKVLDALNARSMPTASDTIWNMRLAVIMARLSYLRAPEAIPALGDIEGMWALYRLRYNSPKGAATRDEFMSNYKKYVAPLYA